MCRYLVSFILLSLLACEGHQKEPVLDRMVSSKLRLSRLVGVWGACQDSTKHVYSFYSIGTTNKGIFRFEHYSDESCTVKSGEADSQWDFDFVLGNESPNGGGDIELVFKLGGDPEKPIEKRIATQYSFVDSSVTLMDFPNIIDELMNLGAPNSVIRLADHPAPLRLHRLPVASDAEIVRASLGQKFAEKLQGKTYIRCTEKKGFKISFSSWDGTKKSLAGEYFWGTFQDVSCVFPDPVATQSRKFGATFLGPEDFIKPYVVNVDFTMASTDTVTDPKVIQTSMDVELAHQLKMIELSRYMDGKTTDRIPYPEANVMAVIEGPQILAGTWKAESVCQSDNSNTYSFKMIFEFSGPNLKIRRENYLPESGDGKTCVVKFSDEVIEGAEYTVDNNLVVQIKYLTFAKLNYALTNVQGYPKLGQFRICADGKDAACLTAVNDFINSLGFSIVPDPDTGVYTLVRDVKVENQTVRHTYRKI